MQAVEDLCVKFLMNEMDPSERFAFEEQLKTDPNLIIEVEMMRKTLGQIKSVPVLKTPEHLTKSVKAIARNNARKGKVIQWFAMPSIRYAAMVAGIGLAFSFGWVLNQSPQSENSHAKVISLQPQKDVASTWQDKKDVISIEAYNVAAQTKADSLALKNAKKLRLIDEPVIGAPYSDDLLLTRTRK
ncbi:hypothetical protein EP331_10605 [bacterium]|nr:MAG: hypothetical protein EP331_10605 [bacterium]